MHADTLGNIYNSIPKLRHKRKASSLHRRHIEATKTYHAQFDSIKTSITGSSALAPVPVPYDGLRFGGFNARNNGVKMIRANSDPNVAGNGPLRDILSGGAPPANITTKYPGSRVKYYKAIKTFIGCAVISTVQAPQPCQILFSGIDSKKAAISQTCSYSGTVKNPAMQECTFGPTFGDVVTLNVTVDESLTVPTTTVLLIDNFNHTNYY